MEKYPDGPVPGEPRQLGSAEPVSIERLLERKAEMEAELQKGQALLQRQQVAAEQTRQTMMHIQGALTLLNELLAEASPEPKIVRVDRLAQTEEAMKTFGDHRGVIDDVEVPESIS